MQIKTNYKFDPYLSLYYFIETFLLWGGTTSATLYLYLNNNYLFLLTMPFMNILTVRMFIIQHDCSHSSFHSRYRYNDIIGRLCSLTNFISYTHWKVNHKHHHNTSSDLNNQNGLGEIYTECVSRYIQFPEWKKTVYKIYRNKFFLIFIYPIFLVLITHRFGTGTYLPFFKTKYRRPTITEMIEIIFLNCFIFYFKKYSIIYLMLNSPAAILSVLLFYTQHNFKNAYYVVDSDKWNYNKAAFEGSSYLKLPTLLSWCVGNINYHHIHHFDTSIPFYNLPKYHNENKHKLEYETLTLNDLQECFNCNLYDDLVVNKMISFNHLEKNINLYLT